MDNEGQMDWHSTMIAENEGKCVGLSFDIDALALTVLIQGRIKAN
jgi:hypothetical protein